MISTRLHGILDYIVGLVLIFSPWALGFAYHGVEMWIPVILGGLVIFSSLFTRYELGVIRVLSLTTNLTLDGIAGAFLALSPWLFDFAIIVWEPHLILGLLVLIGAFATRRVASRETRHR